METREDDDYHFFFSSFKGSQGKDELRNETGPSSPLLLDKTAYRR